MTVPYEEESSLKNTRSFLLNLLDPKVTPRVPRKIRNEARARLKHYPADYIISELYEHRKR